jgi:hypothetical protein
MIRPAQEFARKLHDLNGLKIRMVTTAYKNTPGVGRIVSNTIIIEPKSALGIKVKGAMDSMAKATDLLKSAFPEHSTPQLHLPKDKNNTLSVNFTDLRNDPDHLFAHALLEELKLLGHPHEDDRF